MIRIKKKSMLIISLLVVLGLLYSIFLSMDIFQIETLISVDIIKFLSIVLVFLISLIIGEDSISHKDILLLRLGLFLTLMADFFLLFFPSQYLWGVGLFSIVQILYNIRYEGGAHRDIIYKFTRLFLLFFLFYLILKKFIIDIDFLLILSLYYAICLLSSSSRAIRLLKSPRYPRLNTRMIVVGMILFLLCDINVGIFNLLKLINIWNPSLLFLKKLSYISIWLFYLPSQILLSLSGYRI